MHWLLLLTLAFGPALNADRLRSIGRMNEGIQLARKGDAAGALDLVKEAVALDPSYARAHYTLGQLYRQQEQLLEGRKALRAALDQIDAGDPLAPEIGYELALTILALGDRPGVSRTERTELLRDAVKILDGVLERDAKHAQAHHRRGRALDRLGDPSAADDAYRACIAIDPHASACFVSLGYLYADYGFDAAAVAVLEAGLTVDGASLALWSGLGEVHFRGQRYVEAVDAYKRARTIDPDRPEVQYGLGMAYAELRERKDAVAALSRFLRLAGSDVSDVTKRNANHAIARMQDVL